MHARAHARKKGTTHTPAPGFYRHYDHDPKGPRLNQIFEVLYTVTDKDSREPSVVMRRMFGTRSSNGGGDHFCRKLDIFNQRAEKNGKKVPRYARVTDKALLKELAEERKHRYPAPT